MNDEPIVLVGRGGSGTRLLAQLARANGVFLGTDLNVSSDSDEWVECIYALALESLGPGIEADSVRDFAWRHRIRERAIAVTRRAALGPSAPWGWKLPETILGLTQVLRTFPKAKIVHLVRHPLTSSLRRSHLTSRTDNAIGRAVLAAAYDAYGRERASIDADPDFMRNAITWTFQVARALDVTEAHVAPRRALLLRYEELCADTIAASASFAAFLGYPQATDARTIATSIDRERMGFALRDERADLVWAICGATAARLGYSFTR